MPYQQSTATQRHTTPYYGYRDEARQKYVRSLVLALLVGLFPSLALHDIIKNSEQKYAMYQRSLAVLATPIVIIGTTVTMSIGIILTAAFTIAYPFQYLYARAKDNTAMRSDVEEEQSGVSRSLGLMGGTGFQPSLLHGNIPQRRGPLAPSHTFPASDTEQHSYSERLTGNHPNV